MTLTGLAQHTRTTSRLVVSLSVEEDATVIALQGDADLTALPTLVDMIAGVVADHEGPIVVDLAETASIDTACVRAVGLVAVWLADTGRCMTVRSPSRLAVMLLATLGLSGLIESGEELLR
jgi:anti-anti-sigma regulatory factor